MPTPNYDLIGSPIFRLHMHVVNLCANDVITEEEHDRFEALITEVYDRLTAGEEPDHAPH